MLTITVPLSEPPSSHILAEYNTRQAARIGVHDEEVLLGTGRYTRINQIEFVRSDWS